MNHFSLSITALIPVIALCIYIYAKDRVEKEPIGLLLALFAAGGVAYLPAIFCEDLVIRLFDKLFSKYMIFGLTGIEGFTSVGMNIAHNASCGFIAVALTEEAVKWIILFLMTRRNKNFSHLFDGVIYSVFVSLGFAAMENVRYALMDGWSTFLLRTLTSVPSHMVFGVIMGVFYTLWNVYRIAATSEKDMSEDGTLSVSSPIRFRRWLVLSIAVPVLIHGFYAFIKLFSSDIMEDIFYVLIAVMYIICLITVNKLSKDDSHEESIAQRIIKRKYPEIRESEIEITPDEGEGGVENG